MTKQPRQYKLSHTNNYKIVGSIYIPTYEGDLGFCDNCNAKIAERVFIEDQDGMQYVVSEDCAKTLSSLNEAELNKHIIKLNESIKFHKEWNRLVKSKKEDEKIFAYDNGPKFNVCTYTLNLTTLKIKYIGGIARDSLSHKWLQINCKRREEIIEWNPSVENEISFHMFFK